MWQQVAIEMGTPWRSAESMHWQLGEQEMSARANAPIFQLHPSATSGSMDTESTIGLGDVPLQHQSPRRILAKADPSGVPMVLVPDTRLSMNKEGESLDEPVGRRREDEGDQKKP